MTTEISRINNPFASATSAGNAMTDATTSREVAEIQAAMIIAKRFPRDQIAAMDRILNACARPSLAESALYSYTRGGADVTGPSIRLAEAIAQSWGNIQFGIRELDQTSTDSTVEAFAFDLETNTRQVKVFQVPHVRFTKSGKKKLDDPRDIYELVANQGARRLRACILGVIPGDVVEAARDQCEATLHAHTEATPETIKKMVDAFAAYKVTVDQLQKRLGRRLDSITPANIIQLKKIYQSLKDGMSKPEDWFQPAEPKAAEINERLRQEPPLAENHPDDMKPKSPLVDTETGEIIQPPAMSGRSVAETDAFEELRADPEYSDWCTAIDDCKSIGELAGLINTMDRETKTALRDFMKSRQNEIRQKDASK